jgi:hypothetical protein
MRIVRVFTTRFISSRTANRRGLTSLCLLISLTVVACAAAPQTPEGMLAAAVSPMATPSIHPPDADASYHFMLGYQAELVQDMDRAIQEYQAAL